MLQDEWLIKSVSRIRLRSERQQDMQKLVGTFVDVGILPQLDNFNNQIIYGRRGTGKTHILRVLSSRLSEEKCNAVVYIDARTLGSTSQFSDYAVPLKYRCFSLFKDILAEIQKGLCDYIVNEPIKEKEVNSQALFELSKVMIEPVERHVHNNIVFPDLHLSLKHLLEKFQVTLYILMDEWSSLPIDIQPYLAEFFKRSFFANSQIVVKIASLEYRSNFGIVQESRGILGFEIGSDISTALDIDNYYVYDRNPQKITDAFANMLYKHVRSELPDQYMESNHQISSSSKFISVVFTNKNILEELVRASEGVARDLINIFSIAYFDAERRSRNNIDKKAILEAARQWFEQDKSQNLDEKLQKVLEKIVGEVIGHRRARSFLLPRVLEKHDVIQRLFDSRVLHLMQRGYADKDNPGVRYNIYTLDYGTYVDLINTSKQPDLQLSLDFGEEFKLENEYSEDRVVPFDDKRSIRKVILTDSILK